MDILFVIVVGWLFLTHYVLYAESGVWYYLVTLLGAALSFSYFFVRDSWEFAGLLILIGPILLIAGLASTVTFGANRELARIQASSWKDLLFGIVPEHLRKGSAERRNGILLLSLSFLFALVVFQGGRLATALNIAVIGVVAAIYSFWHRRRKGHADKSKAP
jgi:hypothetical protein